MSVCQGCGVPVAQPIGSGRRRKWCSDQCRKQARYSSVCIDCGGVVRYSGHKEPSLRCAPCRRVYATENKVWTRANLLDAICTYERRYGHPPGAAEWNPAQARSQNRDDLAERFYRDGCWPHATTVQREFGSWNGGIRAAGFEPRRPSQQETYVGAWLTPEQRGDIVDRYGHGESSRDLAAEYGIAVLTVVTWVRKAGGTVRPARRVAA